MDFMKTAGKLHFDLRRYRPVLLVILAGFLLMALPDPKKQTAEPVIAEKIPDFQQQLQDLLSHIAGAGKVRVLLSEEAGTRTIYECREDRSGQQGEFRRDPVILSGADRQEKGLIRQIMAPEYRGAVVIAQGGDNPKVILAIKKAVSSAAGLSTNKITVLKMD